MLAGTAQSRDRRAWPCSPALLMTYLNLNTDGLAMAVTCDFIGDWCPRGNLNPHFRDSMRFHPMPSKAVLPGNSPVRAQARFHPITVRFRALKYHGEYHKRAAAACARTPRRPDAGRLRGATGATCWRSCSGCRRRSRACSPRRAQSSSPSARWPVRLSHLANRAGRSGGSWRARQTRSTPAGPA